MTDNDTKTEEVSEFHDTREHFNIVFIGHVDAGKSTTCGQILLLTEQADERMVEKYKSLAKTNNRESWWIAYIMDTNDEERSKGKTVEVGMASFETSKRRYSILDAPGHKNYIPAMINGASQADIGVLVVSARKGEFEAGFQRGGQTREHGMLAKTLGITKMIIAVNKMDDETVCWDQARFEMIVEKTIEFLRHCGFKEKDIYSLPMSGLLGEGITKPITKGICDWYKGKCMMDALDDLNISRNKSDVLRIPVVDRYKDMGCVVASGKIESGVLRENSALLLMPSCIEISCGMITIDDINVKAAKCGENVNVFLKDIDKKDIFIGDILCQPEHPTPNSSLLTCQIYITELLPHKPLMAVGYSCIFHAHAAAVECEVVKLGLVSANKKEKPKKVLFVKAQSTVIVKLSLERKIAIEKYSDYPQLGRFTLRDEGRTIAIGRVVDIKE